MKPQTATAVRTLHASVEEIYRLIADYKNGHPLILPKRYFHSLEVEEGGYGASTIVLFTMRILGHTQQFRSRITEPEPGRLLVETDVKSDTSTLFHVVPIDCHRTQVTITTTLKGRGILEGFLAKYILQRIYREELDMLARIATKQTAFMKPANHAKDIDRVEL